MEPQSQDPDQQQDEQEREQEQQSSRQDKAAKRPRLLVVDNGGKGGSHGPHEEDEVRRQLVDKFRNTSIDQATELSVENLRSVINHIAALREKEVRDEEVRENEGR